MNATSVPPSSPPAPARKKRWWLRGLLALLALALVTVLGLFAYSHFSTANTWASAEEEAGRDDPRWRLSEIEADRPRVADAENSAFFMIALRKKGRILTSAAPNYETVFEKLPANAQLNAQQVEMIRTGFAAAPGVVEEARKLKDMPSGRFSLKFSDDWISTLIPHHQETREIADWLRHDSWLLAQEGDCDAAIESCQAIVNVSRSVKDDPFLITCLIRYAELAIAMETLERVLAQGEVSEDRLKAMQAMLEREEREDSFALAMRGERAGMHYLFENMRAGKLKTNLFAMMGGPKPAVTGLNPVTDWLVQNFPSTLLKYYPDHLRTMNRLVAASKLPLNERHAKLQEIEREVINSGNPVSRLLMPATHKVERTKIYLRCMAALLACERYRLQNPDKRWPESLDELVKTKLLDAVPTDPIDNQPLRYLRTRDGIVIYSVGFDGKDNKGNLRRDDPNQSGGDLGYQLWDPNQRRRQPLPPVGTKEIKGEP